MRTKSRVAACAAALLAAVAVTTTTVGASDAPTEGVTGAQGTVDTLAGPAHCPHRGVVDPTSLEVRALAVDAEGRVFYETGPPDERAVVASVDEQRRVRTLPSRITQPPVAAGASQAVTATPAGAGRMVADGQGGVLVAAGTRIVRIARDTTLTTIAGDPAGPLGDAGSARTGDGGPAADARFRSATSLAQDTDGNLYVADHGGPSLATATVRFINRTDRPVAFYEGTPEALTVAPGHIATIAGTEDASSDPGGPDGRAVAATFHGNTTLAADGDRLYVGAALRSPATGGDGRPAVRLVNLGGRALTAHGTTVEPGGITVVAGGGDDPTTALDSVAAVTVDGQGNVFVVDRARHRIRVIDAEGFMTTFAGVEGLGADVGGFNGNNRQALGARLHDPFDVAVAPDGAVYIADQGNGQIRVVDDSGHIRVAPGAGVGSTRVCQAPDESGDDPARAQPGGPASLAVDDSGDTYFALADGHQVKRLDSSGQVHTVAGKPGEGCTLGCAGFSGDGGPARDAELHTPTALALGPQGGLYILDGGNARVRYVNVTDAPVTVHGVTVDPGAIATVAGNGTPGTSGDGGAALDTELGQVPPPELVGHGTATANDLVVRRPTNHGALAVDSQGNLIIAETKQYPDWDGFYRDTTTTAQVRQVDVAGTITTLAGTGASGPAAECCHDPAALALDPADNLYVGDASTYQVWFLNRSEQPVELPSETVGPGGIALVAGTGTSGFAGDGGPATQAQLLAPAGLALDSDGNLHIAEFHPAGGYVRSIDAQGTIDVLIGDGRAGFNGDGLNHHLTSINLPTDVAVDRCGNVLVADAGNDRIRRINLTGDCDPAAPQAVSATDNGAIGAGNLALVALAAALGLGGFAAGWYWRRRTRSTPTSPGVR